MDKRTVLVVEDDPEVVRLYTEIFTHRGWRVVEAMDGEGGIEAALAHVPTVIVLDLMLPKKGGLHVLKILKSLPETRAIPVVVMTAYPNPEYKDEAVKSGCDGYFLKTDLSHPKLADMIDELVRGSA